MNNNLWDDLRLKEEENYLFECINDLQEIKLDINEIEKVALKNFILSYGYYNIFNKYSKPFTINHYDLFDDKVNRKMNVYFTSGNATEIIKLYEYDRWVGNYLTDSIHNCERYLLGTILTTMRIYGVDLNKSITNIDFAKMQKIFELNIKDDTNNEKELEQFYLKFLKIKNNISMDTIKNVPINILFRKISFVPLVKYLFYNLKTEIKEFIIQNYFPNFRGINSISFSIIYWTIADFRNIISHNGVCYLQNYKWDYIKKVFDLENKFDKNKLEIIKNDLFKEETIWASYDSSKEPRINLVSILVFISWILNIELYNSHPLQTNLFPEVVFKFLEPLLKWQPEAREYFLNKTGLNKIQNN